MHYSTLSIQDLQRRVRCGDMEAAKALGIIMQHAPLQSTDSTKLGFDTLRMHEVQQEINNGK